MDWFQGPEASLSVGGGGGWKQKRVKLVFSGTEPGDQRDSLTSEGDCSPELLEESSLAEGLAGLNSAATSQWPWGCLGDFASQ